MKKIILLFLFTASLTINGQVHCDDANAYLVSAYSHVKTSYEANNISHLKYYANRSVESFKLAQTELDICDCVEAKKLADKSMKLLVQVDDAETYEDGRFFVKRARELSKECVIEIDKCSIASDSDEGTASSTEDSNDLDELQQEQLKLQQQQEALLLKAEQIKSRLAEQKERALLIEKKELILSYENVLTSNIEMYNKSLDDCDCEQQAINNITSPSDISEKSFEDIKKHYIANLKALASKYLSKLNACK
ncbi:hypothetical protein A8C32_06700 [Flavivirga aquatica]|uniref:DUF4398 domain-containing protein n=1 Tax=Flavivirga aquatica TaxID=1849968 RepID=A0A1E5SID2_9FLAO|nr:hypothetical protein [Flavivirga aquatica]OEJ98871.1 hypothetical protein A8C32_06700 [Flavivirga aquatica]